MVPIVTLGSLLCTDVTPFSSFCFNTRVPAYSWRCNSVPDGGSSPRHRVSLTPQPRGFPLFSQEVGQIWRSSSPGGHVWLAAHPTQKNHPALNLHSLHFLGAGDLGTESSTPRPGFLPPVPVHATCASCAAGRGLRRCPSTARCCSHVVSWQPRLERDGRDRDRAAAAAGAAWLWGFPIHSPNATLMGFAGAEYL